jgi:hypothetical protein
VADATARLARAVHLDAERIAGGAWTVTGGATPHTVTADASACDCTDYTVRGGPCKHILAVRLRSGDSATLDALRGLVVAPRRVRAVREARPEGI